jgi:hypothetical protein
MNFSKYDVDNTFKFIKHPGYDKDIISLKLIKDIQIDSDRNRISISLSFPGFNDSLK